MPPPTLSHMIPSDDLLFADAACGLLLTDASGTILRANRTFCAWLGQDAASLEGAMQFQHLLTVGARIFYQTHWLPLMQLQGAVAEIKLDFKHRLGEKIPMLVNARTIALPNGRICHTISTSVASDRDRYERELLKARSDAEQLLRERTALQEEANERGLFAEQLIGIVSHDLRNPLTAIRIGTEMLVMDDRDPRRLKMSDRIQQSVDRALLLVEDLLDFTLAKTGRELPMRRTPIDLHHVVAAGVDELRLAFPEVTLEHHTAGTGAMFADADRLVRVLGNLVANAVRYGEHNTPIKVESSVKGRLARLEVVNAGTPIPDALMPRLFQAMTRGTGHHGGGVGLGLYIVNQIALGHGGNAFALSDHASGTRMGIEFPAHESAALAAPMQTSDGPDVAPKELQ